MTTDRVPAGFTEKRPFLSLAEKCFFAKNPFFPKKNTKTIIYLGKGYCFVCTTFPGRGLNMARIKSDLFLGQKTGSRLKIRFLPWDPKFCQWPICSPGESVHFAHWDRFFISFYKKKIGQCAKKSFLAHPPKA